MLPHLFENRILITAAPPLSTLIVYLIQIKNSLIRVQIKKVGTKYFTHYQGAELIFIFYFLRN